MSLRFTSFDLADDTLSITDGDGTILGRFKDQYTLPANITSRTNVVKLLFTTSPEHPRSGWSVTWTAVTPGKSKKHHQRWEWEWHR